jgi:phospholipid/cholesterol/gamma-HCH transport system permease protein
VLSIPGITRDVLEFLGEVTQSMARFFSGRASFSRRDLWNVFRECGVDALPIVTLTSLLLGLILAFVSSMQLKLFGAEIYVASLVGVSMVRVMAPVLTGIVLAGRTGASFAAVIGSMQVNEEVDALTGFGISPMDFLVLPRVLGLAIMTPLLTIYSNIAGITGGFLVGVLMLGITPAAYLANTLSFMTMSYVWIGLLHAFIFGILIALCGCYQGIRSGRNASAVGRATTAAVVNSIVGIIVATSIITVIFTVVDL